MSLLNPPKPFLQTNAWQHQQANSLRYNTSQAGSVLPLIYGTTRQQVNLIDFGDYRGPKGKKGKTGPLPIQGQHVGKGGAGSGGKKGVGGKKNSDFSIDVAFAICQGPATIGNTNFVWASAGVAFFQSVGLNLYTGSYTQTADPVFVTLGHNIAYAGTCYVTGTPMDLGASPALPNLSFEVTGIEAGTGGFMYPKDANPKDIVLDFLSDAFHGAGFPSGNIDPNISTLYGDYCQAAQLVMSPALPVQTEAASWLNELAKLTNSAIVWSGALLKFVPYGDLPLATNGATWTPNLIPEYSFDDDSFLPWSPHLDNTAPWEGEDDPVLIDRTDPSDVTNWVSIEYFDRANFYNKNIVAQFDQGMIDLYGLKTEPSIQGNCFCSADPATISARLILQRSIYVRNKYKFQIGWQYMLLEPMDIVLITDRNCQIEDVPVRILIMEENKNGDFIITAEEIASSTSPGISPPVPSGTLDITDLTYFQRGSALIGQADSTSLTFSIWIKPIPFAARPILAYNVEGLVRTYPGLAGVAANTPLMIAIETDGSLFIEFSGSNWSTNHWSGKSRGGVISPDGGWHNIHVTVDTTNFAAPVVFKYDGSSFAVSALSTAGAGGFNIAYSAMVGWLLFTAGYPFGVQASYFGAAQDFYLNLGTIVSDNTKFRTAGGKAVPLGANGQNPTGSPPILFLHWDYTTPGDINLSGGSNFGSGGNFLLGADPVFLEFSEPY